MNGSVYLLLGTIRKAETAPDWLVAESEAVSRW
jgi:hypothetical protein